MMKYIITESQYNLLKEYFDPIYFLKNKMSKKDRFIKDPAFVPYEKKFQKIIDLIFKMTNKLNGPLKHLNGLKVAKVTPTGEKWDILIEPIVDDWFNWKNNQEFLDGLKNYKTSFKEVLRKGAFDSPHDEEGFPRGIDVFFNIN